MQHYQGRAVAAPVDVVEVQPADVEIARCEASSCH
jgi:hypothetical protein